MDMDRKALVAALTRCKDGVSSRPGIPALTGALVRAYADGTATITTTDLEISVVVKLGASGNGISPDGVLIPAKALLAAVKASKAPIVGLELEGDTASIDGVHRIKLLPAEDFPGLAPASQTTGIYADAATFADVCRRVSIAASSDDARPILTGVLLESDGATLTMVATDSYRLNVGTVKLAGDQGAAFKVIVPERALRAVCKGIGPKGAGDVHITLTEHIGGHVDVTYGGIAWQSRVIEGEYPNYGQLIPDVGASDVSVIEGDAADMIAATRAAGNYCRDTTPLSIDVNAAGATLSAQSPDLGSFGPVPFGDYVTTDSDFRIAFNPTYLADGLAVGSRDGRARMEIRDVLKPGVIRNRDGISVVALVMPVRQPAAVS